MNVIKCVYDGGYTVLFVWSDYFNAYIRETSDGCLGIRETENGWESLRIMDNGDEDIASDLYDIPEEAGKYAIRYFS